MDAYRLKIMRDNITHMVDGIFYSILREEWKEPQILTKTTSQEVPKHQNTQLFLSLDNEEATVC